MKKFYSVLALAAAACLTAQAADVKPAAVAVQKASELDLNKVAAPAPQKAPAYAPAANMAELGGIYNGTYELPFKDYDTQSGEFAVVPTGDNKVNVYGITSDPLPGTVDFSKGTITLPGTFDLGDKNFGGTLGTKQVILYTYVANQATGKWEKKENEPFILDIVEGGLKSREGYCYIGDVIGTTSSMITGGYDFNLIKQNEENPEQWHTTGEATFIDDAYFMPIWNWAYFGLSGTPSLTCQFQRSSADENLVALYNPYGGLNDYVHSLGAQFAEDDLNEGDLPGRIVINIANKQCVYVPFTYVGAISTTLFFGTNTEATQIAEGSTTEELIDFMGVDALSNYNEATKVITLKNCLFTARGWRNASWHDIFAEDAPENECPTDMFTIMLPEVESGIKNITVDENAPVEYFNLQGIRVENPAKGLYIKRQGNTATKVIL